MQLQQLEQLPHRLHTRTPATAEGPRLLRYKTIGNQIAATRPVSYGMENSLIPIYLIIILY